MPTSIYLVSPSGRVTAYHSVASAMAAARRQERRAKSVHGQAAGADCHLVTRTGAGSLSYRGLVCGRTLIGRTWGCAEGIVRLVADAIGAR